MATPLVSVVVSARGNGAALCRLLDALASQSLPAGCLEAVLVDNDPRRRRGAVAAAGCRARPFPVTVVDEPVAGVSRGRNRGVRVARGHYVAFIDPDVVPAPGWLEALVAAAEQEAAFMVGGRVDTDYVEGTALPLTRTLAECHGPLEWPPQRAPYRWPYWISCCNLLFHREIGLRLGLLRTDLGRRGRWLLDGEDLEFADRARQHGLSVLIEPAAVVWHPVRRRETTVGWFLAQGAGHGVCVARMGTSVCVEPAAIRADRDAVLAAITSVVAGWGFLDSGSAVEGARDLVRIAAYRVEQARLALTCHWAVHRAPHSFSRPALADGVAW